MKRFLFLLLLWPALLLGVDAANDVILSQRKPDNSGFIQRNVPAQNAITSASLPSFQSAIGLGTEDSPTFSGLTLSTTPLAPASGGTGLASYAVGDIIYASGATTLAKLADVAVGSVLLSGGVGAAPSYGGAPAGTLTGTALAANVVTSSLTTVGALTSGSIGSGFGSINVGANSISGGAVSGTTGTFNQTVWSGAATFTQGSAYVDSATGLTLASKTGSSYDFVVYNPGQTSALARVPTGQNYFEFPQGINDTPVGATTPAAGSFTTLAANQNVDFTQNIAGSQYMQQVNTSTNAAAAVNFFQYNSGAGAGGDTWIRQFAGTENWSFGVDNSDSSAWKLSRSGALGTNDVLRASSTGLDVTGALSATGKTAFNSPSNTSGAISAAFNNAGGNTGLLLISTDDQSNTSYAVFTNSAVGTCGSISRVTTTNAVAYNTTSDGRLKTNVRDFTAADAGRIIDGLKPRWFDWKASDLKETVDVVDDTPLPTSGTVTMPTDDGFGAAAKGSHVVTIKEVTTNGGVDFGQIKPDVRHKKVTRKVTDSKRLADHAANNKSIIGFIAQEEAAVDPALVRIGAVTVGDDDPTTITKQWQRSDSALIPILVAELKSLRARVAALEAKSK